MTREIISPRVIKIRPSKTLDRRIQKLLKDKVLLEEGLGGHAVRFNVGVEFVLFGERLNRDTRCSNGLRGKYAIHDVYSHADKKFLGPMEKREVIKDMKRGVFPLRKARSPEQFFEVPLIETGEFTIDGIVELCRSLRSACFRMNGEPSFVSSILVKPAEPRTPGSFVVGKLRRSDFF